MSDGREYELKFEIDPAEADRLLSHPALVEAFQGAHAKRLVSTYFDTPDGRLRKRKVALRIRRTPDGLVQTAKRTGGSHVDRDEWEHETDFEEPDFDALRRTPLKKLMSRGVERRVAPCFAVDVARTAVALDEDGTEIEGALDRGTVQAGGLSLPISEFELEVKRGSSDALYSLARRLVADLPLVLSLTTKSERGHALATGSWGRPTKTIRPALSEVETIEGAFEAIVQECLHVLLKNVTLISGDAGVEPVHTARIAIRHLRAVFALFKPALRRSPAKRLRDDIKWMSDLLGDARDADVLLFDRIEPASRDDAAPGMAALASLFREERRRAYERLGEGLASPRWRLLLVDLLLASTNGVRASSRGASYQVFALYRLETQRKALAKQARGLKRMDPADRHDVRKAAKMLRYAMDVFREVEAIGDRKRVRRLGRHLQTLQQTLGALHDDEAIRDQLRATFVGRFAPMGTRPRDWIDAAFAAGTLTAAPVEGDGLLRASTKAAKAVRKTKVKRKNQTIQ